MSSSSLPIDVNTWPLVDLHNFFSKDYQEQLVRDEICYALNTNQYLLLALVDITNSDLMMFHMIFKDCDETIHPMFYICREFLSTIMHAGFLLIKKETISSDEALQYIMGNLKFEQSYNLDEFNKDIYAVKYKLNEKRFIDIIVHWLQILPIYN